MDTYRIAIKKPDRELEVINFEGTYRSDIEPLIFEPDNWSKLEYVILKNDGDSCLAMAVDEDGLAKQLPPNFNLITYAGNHALFNDIVGNAAFIRYQLENTWEKEIWVFKLQHLTDEDIQLIKMIVSPAFQERERYRRAADPSILYQKGIYTVYENACNQSNLKSVPLTDLLYFIMTYFSTGTEVTFYSDHEGQSAHRITIQKGKKKDAVFQYFNRLLAQSFSISIPCDDQVPDFGLRLGKIKPFHDQLRSLGIEEDIYVRDSLAANIEHEVFLFRRACRNSRQGYAIYACVFNHLSIAMFEKILEILDYTMNNLKSEDRRRRYLAKALSGILPKEEIDSIDFSLWEEGVYE